MTWIKICGTRNLEDALVAVDAGADAVGFVFYEKSPRNVSAKRVKSIVKNLPAGVEKVGVFVNDSAERICAVVDDVGLTAVQIYGNSLVQSARPEGDTTLPTYGFKVIAAMSSKELEPGAKISGSLPGAMVYALLLDSGSGERPGGTGTRFDWGHSSEYVRRLGGVSGMRIIVAGGLTPENVPDAVEMFTPWGVDVVSGVEAAPGKKDPQKVRAFVKAVRDKDRKAS